MLDLVHRIYEADESFRTLNFMVHTRLYFSQIVLQICIGTLVPIFLLAIVQVTKLPALVRKRIYVVSGCLVQIGVFAMRWNVVIGGQLFSKSFLGYTTYKMGLVTKEGLLMAIFLTILPLVLLWGLMKLLPPWPEKRAGRAGTRGLNAAPRGVLSFKLLTASRSPTSYHAAPGSASNDARTLAAGLWLERNQSSCGLAKSMRCGFP